MKKEYMKPVMESEMFVANEYVGACFNMDCDCIDPTLIYGTDANDAINQYAKNNNGKAYPSPNNGGSYIYDGKINESSGCFENDDHNNSRWLSIINYFIGKLNDAIPGTDNDFLLFPNEGLEGAHHHVSVTPYPDRPNHS